MTALVPPGFDAVLEAAAPLTDAFQAAGRKLFLVGGVVRDHWLGIERHDNDLDATTDARPPEIKALVAPLADVVWTQGERFGTIGCTIDGRMYEITTHRTEVYTADSRKPEVAFGERIDDDLARRDFTVNAMAIDLVERDLVDPFDGRGDLARRILRTPLEPEIAFSEDPLRMLRAARFHAGYSLEPTPELVVAVAAMGERMSIVSAERVREELDKLLRLPEPGPGLRFLHRTGLMRYIVPELADASATMVDGVGRRITAVEASSAHRWAALLLDVADPYARLAALRSSGHHTEAVSTLVQAGRWLDDELVPHGAAEVRRAAASSRIPIDEMVAFVRAIRYADGRDLGAVERLSAELVALRRAEPDLDAPMSPLTGDDVIELLGIDEGPDVGRAMDWLREQRFVEGPLDPDKAAERLAVWWRGDA